jgi:hypothetical protein
LITTTCQESQHFSLSPFGLEIAEVLISGSARRNQIMEAAELKVFVDELRIQWKDLWLNRIEDKVRAEGLANRDYSGLFVERGTVIKATRDYKPLDFFDIVQEHLTVDAEKVVPPNSTIGGWGKFIRKKIRNQKKITRRYIPSKPSHKKGQQLKKGGRGWLHTKMK